MQDSPSIKPVQRPCVQCEYILVVPNFGEQVKCPECGGVWTTSDLLRTAGTSAREIAGDRAFRFTARALGCTLLIGLLSAALVAGGWLLIWFLLGGPQHRS
jgi:hypothetical protein